MTAAVQIGTLRLRTSGVPHGANLRARLMASMTQGDLHPPGLPPGCILIVRRLGDPLPRRVLVGGNARLNQDWQSKTRDALVLSYKSALRPAHGPVPAGAAAVVFADEAEMLACLLKDAVKREAPRHWWWKYADRPGNDWAPAAIAGARARWIPATFAWLIERRELSTLLAAIGPVNADRLRRAMLAAFEIPPVPSPSTFTNKPPALEQLPAWVETLFSTAAAHGLDLERERLIATASLLHRDPAVLRSPLIQRALLASPSTYLMNREGAISPATEPVPGILDDRARKTQFESSNTADSRAHPVEHADVAQNDESRLSPHPEDGVQTGLAGVLFLINLLRAGKFAAYFADSESSSTPINGWEMLDAIARGLLADIDAPLLSDPIWHSLAHLAGRDADQPLGASLRQDNSCHLPAAWIALDCESPRDSTPPPLAGLLCESITPNLRNWLGLSLPSIRQHLSRALKIHPNEIPATLLTHTGRLYITRTHVDLKLPLSGALPCIRAACFDCDPGWVPFLGRIIRFHFD